MDAYELRWLRRPGAWGRQRVGELSDEAACAVAEVAARRGVAISALSPGLFHSVWSDASELEGQMARLERCLRLAEILGTTQIVVYGFLPPAGRRNGVCPPQLLEVLSQAAGRASAAGMRLLLRNAPDCYCDSGAHTGSVVHAVRAPALGVSWDPCHAARVGERAICEGYEWVAPFVCDVRVRDQRQQDELGYEYTVLDQGCMDWPGQLRALVADGYQGTVTVDSPLEPRLLNTLHNLEALRGLLRAAQGA